MLTVSSIGRRFKGPDLFLLQAGAVGVDLEAEGLSGEVLVAGIDQTDGPPPSLLVLRDDVPSGGRAVGGAVVVTVQTVHRHCGAAKKRTNKYGAMKGGMDLN